MTDDFELAITAYALTLMKSPNARGALSKLGSSSRIVSSTDINGKLHYLNTTFTGIQNADFNSVIK